MSLMLKERRRAFLFGILLAIALGGLPASAGDGGLYQKAGGIEAYIGFVPAEITQGHAATNADEPMHGGVPRGSHQYHLVAAVFESDSGARISNAMVTAQVSGLALSGPRKVMDSMTIAGTRTYGTYFELPGADLYTIVLTIKRPGATKPVTLKFTYDHRNPRSELSALRLKRMRHTAKDGDTAYERAFHEAQVELVKFQKHVIRHGQKVLVIFEGRDASGKDGTIKRIVEHLSPRETRVVALGMPSDRDRRAWYFQRYVEQLPIGGEIVLFNRSWYNRAGVERVMGFCTDAEYEEFMKTVPMFEQMLVHCGFTILKYYLDISREEQERRLRQRRKDPLRQWKLSPVDAKAAKHWKDYSEARNMMLARTHSVFAPWIIVRADDKRSARLNVIRDLLSRCEFHGKDRHGPTPDPNAVFLYDASQLEKGMIAE